MICEMDSNLNEKLTFWEKNTETKWGHYINDLERDVIIEASDLCESKDLVFEVGCDGGAWLKMLAGRGWKNFIGTDINQEPLEICRRRVPNCRCILVQPGDTHLPCENRSVDLILVMEVVPVSHSRWFYREAFRILKPGGLVVGMLTNKFSLRGLLYMLLTKLGKRCRDEYQASYSKSYGYWKKIIIENGFEFIHQQGYCWFPFGRSSNSFLVPFFTSLEKFIGLRKLTVLSPWINFIARKVK
jgi:SAM-dependent methyltransferase